MTSLPAASVCAMCCFQQREPVAGGATLCRLDATKVIIHIRNRSCPIGQHGNPAIQDRPECPETGQQPTIPPRSLENPPDAPPTPPPAPQPYGQWPAWAKTLGYFRKAGDGGVGDTVQRIAARIGGERFKKFAAKLHIPCGCTARQAEWNTRYPYTALS